MTEHEPMKISDVLLGIVPQEYQQRYHEEQINTNLSRMCGLAGYLLFIQIIQSVLSVFRPVDMKGCRHDVFVALSIAALVVGAIFLILGIQCKKGTIKNPKVRQWLPYVLVYLFTVFQFLFFGLSAQGGAAGMNSYMSAVIVISLCLIVEPILSIANVGACMGVAMWVMFLQRDQNRLWQGLWMADTWVNLMILTIFVVVMSSLTYYMYVGNFINRMRLEATLEQATALARVDTLTGALNRRGFFEVLGVWWPLLMKQDSKVSVAMFDIDHFKAYNDHYGHLAGDNCLLQVASELRGFFYERGDCFCRFGGEEFLAVFYTGAGEDPRAVIDGARQAVESLGIKSAPKAKSRNVSVSVGFVTARAAETDYETMINQADIALYHSKRGGRNRLSEYEGGEDVDARRTRGDGQAGGQEYIGVEKRAEPRVPSTQKS